MLQTFPATVKEMVDQSPFTTDDNLLYVGSKKTSLFIINSESGEVHACYG